MVNILYISQINFTCYGTFLRFGLNNVFQFASILHLSDALPSHWVDPWSHLKTLPLKSQIPCDQEQINYRMVIEYRMSIYTVYYTGVTNDIVPSNHSQKRGKCNNVRERPLMTSNIRVGRSKIVPKMGRYRVGGFFQKVRFVFQISKSQKKKNIPQNYPELEI